MEPEKDPVPSDEKRVRMDTVCRSGGAVGADGKWTDCACEAGLSVEVSSFPGHARGRVHEKAKIVELSDARLCEHEKTLRETCSSLGVAFPSKGTTTWKYLSRNMHIVREADAVYAVGKLDTSRTSTKLAGGTAYGCQAFFDAHERDGPMNLFVHMDGGWHRAIRSGETCEWVTLKDVPKPATFAVVGMIGSREMQEGQSNAIEALF